MNTKSFTPDPYVRRDLRDIKNTTTTTSRTYAILKELIYPQDFDLLASDQQRDVLIELKKLPAHLHQQILDEWQARCLTQGIRNRAAYLFGIIKKARSGEFRLNEALEEEWEE